MTISKISMLAVLLFFVLTLHAAPLQTSPKIILRFDQQQEYGKDTNWDEILFRDNYSLCVSDDGRTFVLDTGGNAVHFFDSQGKYLKSVGSPGNGPGDLYYPWRMNLVNNKFLSVTEHPMAHAATLFDLEGTFLEKIMIDRPCRKVYVLPTRIIYMAMGIVDEEYIYRFFARSRKKGLEEDLLLIQKDISGSSQVKVPGHESIYIADVYFSGEVFSAMSGNGELIIGESDKDELTFYNDKGKLIKKVDLGLVATEMTGKYIDAYKEKSIRDRPKPSADFIILRKKFEQGLREKTITYKNLPFYRQFFLDTRGNILVFMNDLSLDSHEQTIRVYTPGGVFKVEFTIDLKGYCLDLNSMNYRARQYFAFTKESVFALLPKEDEEGEILYRIYKKKFKY